MNPEELFQLEIEYTPQVFLITFITYLTCILIFYRCCCHENNRGELSWFAISNNAKVTRESRKKMM